MEQRRVQVQLIPSALWRPPEEGKFKVNTDAAIDLNNKMAVASMVIRDHAGMVHKLGTKMFSGIACMEMAEHLAIWSGLGICSSVIDHRQLIAEDIVALGNKVDEIMFSHVRRDGNRLVHSLANGVCKIE
ncbi:uncharacterized protein LOC126656715 [Mercurialis annua]|uniref:uncharacterized protein LOC126656715 n=1 Tax=Mercurialis annua TaxID=3986 RepID=UPI00216026A7|nr:uncharacterized protein LOC126656715 [Mercurialis annua]